MPGNATSACRARPHPIWSAHGLQQLDQQSERGVRLRDVRTLEAAAEFTLAQLQALLRRLALDLGVRQARGGLQLQQLFGQRDTRRRLPMGLPVQSEPSLNTIFTCSGLAWPDSPLGVQGRR